MANPDENGAIDVSISEPEAPVNLRVAEHPYPHLRDDGGCVLARDYYRPRLLAFILLAVQEKIERDR